MKTLPMLVAALLVGAAANAPAAQDQDVATITITAKRPHSSGATAEMLPPKAAVVIAPLPTDMPEMEIDSHLTLIEIASVPVVERVAL